MVRIQRRGGVDGSGCFRVMARKTGRVWTHVICLIIGGLGLISMYLFKDPHMLIISMTAIGIAWASLLTMPYAILSTCGAS